MSTSVDARRRPNLWSYISFGSTAPRHRASSIPTRADADPYEKPNRHTHGRTGSTTFSGGSYTGGLMAQSPRGRFLRAFGLVAFIVCIFLWLAPKERAKVEGLVGEYGYNPFKAPGSGPGTCTKSYSADKPLHQYALMIDAGSTGSRIHVYRFNNCKATPELEHETFEMTEQKKEGGTGLSAHKDDPEAAARSLDVLMQAAMEAVPDEYKSCSPLAVKATAGLRLLGEEKSNQILAAVRRRLETEFPFPVVSAANQGVAVMDGKDEGVYAWITINYLLGTIGERAKTPTVATFDLGGASTQIVFEPTFKAPDRLAEGDHKYQLTFGGRAFELYQHSHLGYGLMQARAHIHSAVAAAKKAAHTATDSAWHERPLEHPCLPPGVTTPPINVTLPDGAAHLLRMTGSPADKPGTTAAQCRGLAERILEKEAPCALAPCSFNGVHQPSLERTFAREEVYLFSYFYDRLQPLGMPASFTLREVRDLAARVCEGASGWKAFEAVEGAVRELQEEPQYCLDLNFMMALLHTGYEMPIDREVRIAKKVKGNELGWCLGASLPLLSQDSGWTCKVKKID